MSDGWIPKRIVLENIREGCRKAVKPRRGRRDKERTSEPGHCEVSGVRAAFGLVASDRKFMILGLWGCGSREDGRRSKV